MPHYKGTLWSLTSKVLYQFGSDGRLKQKAQARSKRDESQRKRTGGGEASAHGGGGVGDGPEGSLPCSWPDLLLAAVTQVVLHTIPRAKQSHLVAHNDLKIDNIGYRHTERPFVYVGEGSGRECASGG